MSARYPSSSWLLWVSTCLLSLGVLTRALELQGLFEFGEEAGDLQLLPGSDSTAELPLNGSLFFFGDTFDKVYINTNGFVSVVEPPSEEQYLGKMPASFKMIAALLGDLDDSDGRGKVHFRWDSSPGARNRTAEHVRRAFPRDDVEQPAGVLVVTWENVAARGTPGRGDGPDTKRNTFQLVVASMELSSFAILLYPRDRLQFLSTPVGGESKLLEAGFNEGLVVGWWWSEKQGTYFRTTTDEETSIRELTEKTNSGQNGVWVYEIGSSPFFVAITPGMGATLPEEDATEPPVTVSPSRTEKAQVVPEENEESPTDETPNEYRPVTAEYVEPETEEPDYAEYPETETPTYSEPERADPRSPEPSGPRHPDRSETGSPRFEPLQPTVPETTEPRDPTSEPRYPERTESGFPVSERTESGYPVSEGTESGYPVSEPLQPTYTVPESTEPRDPTSEPRYPERTESRYAVSERTESGYPVSEGTESGYPVSEPLQPRYTYPENVESRYSPVQPRYPEPVEPVPPRSRSQQPQIVVIDEDENLDVNVFAYNSETCVLNRHKCSAFADCRDYSNGYCCQCRPGFYGNGKDCVAEGKPQRMNGKVNGRVFVGNSPSPVEISNNDLHSYVVANDGRAYVAISNIPDSLGPSLQPLSSLGGVIGWAFALEQPGYQNGFSLIGGVFSRQAEVIFQPGNERLSIKQQFTGIDEHDHLGVTTELEGRVPAVPLGSSVQISPYKEIYQYDTNLITSSSNRDYTVTPRGGGGAQTRSYQWRQTISFQSCPHAEAAAPATQQLTVDQIFVMFDADNHLIRYAMSNKIGSVHGGLPEQNPCFTGRHGCDINAACRPGDGLHFTCQCSAGFTGDGRYCHDMDECRETPQVCGPNAVCSNQPGTFRCECLSGFVFASDGRTCIEETRPVDHCQRGSHDCDAADRALCSYTGGSAFVCSCLTGFVGDGRVCREQIVQVEWSGKGAGPRDVDRQLIGRSPHVGLASPGFHNRAVQQDRCHHDAFCSNTQGSYNCQCRPGFHGDGFQCRPASSEREKTACERHRESAQTATSGSGIFSFFRPRPAVGQYVPQCDPHGAYEPTQCHAAIGQCWCVDGGGQEVPNTRTGPGSTPLCIDQAVTPAPVGPTPRPDVHPVAAGTHLLFAQSGKIEQVPLDGYTIRKEEAKPLLHIPDRVVIAVAYDCVEKMVYWTDITGPAISRASLSGGDIIPVITTELLSPEGIAIDHVARLLFWTDSIRDTVEVSKLDGSQRRVLFDTDLINPRPIVTNPAYGRLYWADWNRDGPKIEMSNMDGTDRTVLVKDDLGLPNGLTFDLEDQQLCWADAGTRKVECMDPHRRLRRQIVEGIQYPFALVSFGRKLYYTDWRREAVVSVDRHSEEETEEFLPQKRSRPYGITTASTKCPQVYNYCSDNGGCSHLCLPLYLKLGGYSLVLPGRRCAEVAFIWRRARDTAAAPPQPHPHPHLGNHKLKHT
ncbi:nidogen-1-like [Perca flavescens]|uniref:nidogen-1-like n=1 Tax=Perca flavescens TaxID=8167 RepID=UPI00106F00AE|nr:nidogen-1-like [Perca flavescens]